MSQAAAGAEAPAALPKLQAHQALKNARAEFYGANNFDVAETMMNKGLIMAAPVSGSQTFSAGSLVTR